MKKVILLRRKDDFRAIFRGGRRKDSPLFGAVFKKNQLEYPRFAFVAPRSVDKRATARNKLKRMAREWVRKNFSLFTNPVDVVIVFKKEAIKYPRFNFYKELDKIFKQINI